MIKRKSYLVILLITHTLLYGQAKVGPGPNPQRWEKSIRQFEQWDSRNSVPRDAVLFVGSSSIRMWATHKCFADLPVINRCFGGSHISDVNYYADRIVLPYKPRVIVLYAGDNDIASGKTPRRVAEDFGRFTKLVKGRLAGTGIIFISIKPSSSRWSLWPAMKEANTLIKEVCEKQDNVFFVDAATVLFSDNERPNDKLFRPDKLHLNSQGYEKWTELLRPVILKVLGGKTSKD